MAPTKKVLIASTAATLMAASGAYMLLRPTPDRVEASQTAQPASKGYVDSSVESLRNSFADWLNPKFKEQEGKSAEQNGRLAALEAEVKALKGKGNQAKPKSAKENQHPKGTKNEKAQAADPAKLSHLMPAQQQSAPSQYDQYGQDPAQQVYTQQPQQQAADPVAQQPLYVQQPVVIEGYGTLGLGYTIPACPWSPWQSPFYGYPYAVCYGYNGWGWNLWWNRGGRWGRGFYGGRDFGRYFGRNNIASRSYSGNNYGASRAQGSTSRSGEGGWNRLSGRQGTPQSQSRAQGSGMQRQNVSNMLRQQHNQFNQMHSQQMLRQAPQQHMQQHASAPSYHSQAPASHAGASGVHSSEGRHR